MLWWWDTTEIPSKKQRWHIGNGSIVSTLLLRVRGLPEQWLSKKNFRGSYRRQKHSKCVVIHTTIFNRRYESSFTVGIVQCHSFGISGECTFFSDKPDESSCDSSSVYGQSRASSKKINWDAFSTTETPKKKENISPKTRTQWKSFLKNKLRAVTLPKASSNGFDSKTSMGWIDRSSKSMDESY